MNIKKLFTPILITYLFLSTRSFTQQNAEPWNDDQLLEPNELVTMLEQPDSNKILLISVGPAGVIKGSAETGEAKEKQNLENLKSLLKKQDKEKQIIIYCGCCPFKDCPNIRPAFRLLNKMKFVNHKLLNLPHNIKVDWINKNFPINEN